MEKHKYKVTNQQLITDKKLPPNGMKVSCTIAEISMLSHLKESIKVTSEASIDVQIFTEKPTFKATCHMRHEWYWLGNQVPQNWM
jgi:hypothetical protein